MDPSKLGVGGDVWDPLTARRHRQMQAYADVCGGIPPLHRGIEFARHAIDRISDIRLRCTKYSDLLYELLAPFAGDVRTYTYTYTHECIIQCVPLATEPGISLIILTPMKIL